MVKWSPVVRGVLERGIYYSWDALEEKEPSHVCMLPEDLSQLEILVEC